LNNEKSSQAENIAQSVATVSDSKGLVAIGHGIGWGIAALAAALMLFGMSAAQKWNGNLHPQPQCFDLKEVADKIIKINTCTGETKEISAIRHEQ